MRRPLRIVLATIAFWAVWAGVAGLAATIHGDCGVGATGPAIAACVHDKRTLALIVLALGLLPCALILWALTRRR